MDPGDDIIDVLYRYRDYSAYSRSQSRYLPYIYQYTLHPTLACRTQASLSPTPPSSSAAREDLEEEDSIEEEEPIYSSHNEAPKAKGRPIDEPEKPPIPAPDVAIKRGVRADLIPAGDRLFHRRLEATVELPNGVKVAAKRSLPSASSSRESDYVVTQSDYGCGFYGHQRRRQFPTVVEDQALYSSIQGMSPVPESPTGSPVATKESQTDFNEPYSCLFVSGNPSH